MPENDAARSHPAVASVARRALAQTSSAEGRLSRHGVPAASVAALAGDLVTGSRLTLNFHPDRRDSQGRTVAAGLLADGRYRSQFETGVSNGERSAVPGGRRMRWEHSLFGGVYDDERLTRPVYGALDLFGDPYGGSPRFGSCFVLLESHCRARATLCVGDSHLGPVDVGTADQLVSILAGAVEACSTGDGFGRGLSAAALLSELTCGAREARSARELDHYIEAQVHGGVDLDRDVASIVVDPSFRETDIERDLAAAAERFGFDIGWNEGSEMCPESIDPEFRGSDMLPLARSVARGDGRVDAAAIGAALDELAFTAPSHTGDPPGSELQRYKKLWHCCLEFGSPHQNAWHGTA